MGTEILYVGLRIPDERRAIDEEDDPSAALLAWLCARELAGELPPRVDVDEVLKRPPTSEESDFGRYIYARDRDGWRPLQTLCAAPGVDLIHNTRGQHEWGYGGHGPGDAAFSLIIDVVGAAVRGAALGWIDSFVARLGRDEEWSLGAADIARAMERPLSPLPRRRRMRWPRLARR